MIKSCIVKARIIELYFSLGFRYSHCIHAEVVCMLVASHDVAEEIIPEDYLFGKYLNVSYNMPIRNLLILMCCRSQISSDFQPTRGMYA